MMMWFCWSLQKIFLSLSIEERTLENSVQSVQSVQNKKTGTPKNEDAGLVGLLRARKSKENRPCHLVQIHLDPYLSSKFQDLQAFFF